MPTPAATPEDEIVAALRAFPAGATLPEIEQALPIPRRQLAASLMLLFQNDRILFEGDRYRLAPSELAGGAPAANAPVAKGEPTPATPPPAASSSVLPKEAKTEGTPGPVAAEKATAPAAQPVPSDPHRFDLLFEDCVNEYVPTPLSRTSTFLCLRRAARESLTDNNERRAFVAFAKERFDQLTLEQAVAYGLEPEQYHAWRVAYLQELPAVAGADPVTPEEERADVKPDAYPARNPAVRRAPGRAQTAGSGSPRTLAKQLADQIAQLTGGNSALLKVVLMTLALALIAPLTQWLTNSPVVAGAILVAVVAGVLLFVWAKRGDQPHGEADDETPGQSRHSLQEETEVTEQGVRANAPDRSPLPSLPPVKTQGSQRRRYIVAGAGIVLLLALAGGVFLSFSARQHPPIARVRELVESGLSTLPVRVVAVDVKYGTTTSAGCPISYKAVLETTAPLYRRTDSAEYLSTHAGPETMAINAALALLSSPNGARLRALAGPDPLGDAAAPVVASSSLVSHAAPTDLASRLTLLTTQTAPGFSVVANGSALAYRHENGWGFSELILGTDRSRFPGEPKKTGATVFAIDDLADEARLKALLADEVTYAAKVQAAAKTLAAEIDREHQKAEAFGQLLRVGTLFSGTVRTPRGDTSSVTIEISEALATNRRITALLRNDGGWADARPFRGEWVVSADADLCTVTLRTRSDDRVPEAGPLVQDQGDMTLNLELRADGSLSGSPGSWQLRRIEPADVAAAKAELSHAIASAVAAMKPGTLYRGTATAWKSSTSGATLNGASVYPLLLRVASQDAGTLQVRATLESPHALNITRVFRGTIVDDAYRAGSTPIRLQSADNERAVHADPKSPLGLNTDNNSLTLALRVDGNRLVGQDSRYTYQFEVVAPSEVAAIGQGTTNTAMAGGSAADYSATTYGDRPVSGPGVAGLAEPGRQTATDSPATASGYRLSVASGAAAGKIVPYPKAPGGYALIDGEWQRLPENNGRIYQSTPQSLTAKLAAFQMQMDKKAGIMVTPAKEAVADLTFDGRDPVPLMQADDVVMVYVGRITPPTVQQIEDYPHLKNEPAIELAPTKALRNGARVAPLYLIAPGFMGYTTNRTTAVVDQPAKDITVLHTPAPLSAGRYALFCGARSYEVQVVD